jgi:2-methylcitrate dehydratase
MLETNSKRTTQNPAGEVYLANELSRYVSSVGFNDLDTRTLAEAKRRIVDAVGCAIGAYGETPVKIARKFARGIGAEQPSTIMGTGLRTSPDVASFVNGLMIRYFDFNDTYLSKEPAHPSDKLGGTLSVADSLGARGKDLILSTVLAYEIQCRLCDAADIRHRGWDHVCYGMVSSALGAGKLLKLNENQMAEAVNIALNGHIAMRQVRAGELSMWKGASFANASRNAVFAALLAKDGMTGPSPIFEGEMGFFKQVSGPFKLDVSRFGGRKGKFKIVDTYVKYYPAEYHSQTAIWAALEIRKKVSRPNDIESVKIDSHEAGYTILGKDPEKWRPATKETADHSLPYIVGMALLEGKIDNSTYSEKKIKNENNLNFLKKITVKEDKRLTGLYPVRGMANRVTVQLKSGRKISREVILPRGHPRNPMSNQEVEDKFKGLTKRYLSSRSVENVLETLWNLEKVRDVSEILEQLVVK